MQARLARRLRPFIFRRLKTEVAKDLPAKLEQVSFCELTDEQAEIYKQVLAVSKKEVMDAVGAQGLAKSKMIVLNALLRLRQICCDLRLLKLEDAQFTDDHSGKLELFGELAAADAAAGDAQSGRRPPRELWMNTSEAEIQPAVSPLYEISKRLQGQLLSLRSLDLAGPQLRIRRLVLGPFRSALNPIGVMSAEFVAREVLRQARWDWGLVIVTPNPLTYVLMPLASLSRWLYFSVMSRPSP